MKISPEGNVVPSILLAGIVSNVARSLEKDLSIVVEALSDYEVSSIYLVESDSNDETLGVLSALKSKIPNFNFVSLGSLHTAIPNRIERIRFCRQEYVQFIRDFSQETQVDYVVVADLDGMNSKLTKEGVQSVFNRSDWGAVLANQSGGYYDLSALRHTTWCPEDPIAKLRAALSTLEFSTTSGRTEPSNLFHFLGREKLMKSLLYSKMKVIHPSAPWIEVDSGFGGFAIYKAKLFLQFDYSRSGDESTNECEHVVFNQRIRQSGQKIYINPALVNSRWNTHNVNRFLIVRLVRRFYWRTLKILSK